MEDTAGGNTVSLSRDVFRVNCPSRFFWLMFGSSSKGKWPGFEELSAQCRVLVKWPLCRRCAELLPIGGFNINLENLHIENINVGFCALPVGRWIQPRATWNCKTLALRTYWISDMKSCQFDFSFLYSQFISLQHSKKSQCVSIHLSLFIPLHSQWFLPNEKPAFPDDKNTCLFGYSHQSICYRSRHCLLFCLVDIYKSTIYARGSNDIRLSGSQAACLWASAKLIEPFKVFTLLGANHF